MSEKPQHRNNLLGAVKETLSGLFSRNNDKNTIEAKAKDPHVLVVPYQEPPAQTPKQEILQAKLKKYVTEHISDSHLTAQEIATGLKISRATLFNMSQEAFGMTPINYILEKRMNYAVHLLKMGIKPYQVATRCGYADPKYFGKVFKKRYGILPSQGKELIIIQKQQTQDA